MIIKSVTVKRLRAIKEKTIDFSPALNIIKGSDNESGKSSLRIAITKALFQDPTTTRKDIEALTSWGTDEPWEVTLEFDANGDCYRITRSFKDKTCELVCTGAHEFVARNKNAITEKVAELTGCPSEVFFESTACIGQDELIRIIPNGATPGEKQDAVGMVTKRLQSRLSGTEGVDVPALLARLYAKTHHKNAGGPYCRLEAIIEQIASLRSQEQEQDQKVSDILEKRQRLAQAREELAALSQDLPAKQGLLGKNKRILELQKEVARDKVQYENFQRAKEFKSRADNLESELRPYSHFADAEGKAEHVDAVQKRLIDLSRRCAELRGDLEAFARQRPAPWTLVSGIALVAGGLTGLVANPFFGIAAAVGLVFGAYWVITRAAWDRQMKLAARKASDVEKALQESGAEVKRLLNEFGCNEYDDYVRRLAEYRKRTGDRRDAINQLDVLVAGKDWQEFVEENADLSIQMSGRLTELQQLESFKLEPLPLQKLEDEVSRLLVRKAALEQETGALETFFQYTDADKDLLTEIKEQLKRLEQERDFWEKKRAVYDMTRKLLEEAHKQTLSKAADLLEADSSHYIAIMTDGRYDRVKINETDLSIHTFSRDKNDWVEVTGLSRATQDQFYICARLALVRLITEGKKPPILLDDPFVNFHAKRLKRTMGLLQEIARENQVLLFTCSDQYDYLGTVVSIA